MRPILILAVALLAWALSTPARAPEPLVARMLPALPVAATAQLDGATVVAWRPPSGQVLACAYRERPLPMELLGCVRGGASALVYGPGGDINLQVEAGDTVEMRTHNARGEELSRGRGVIRWRVWLPAARR